MFRSLNKVMLIGNVGKDPEMNYTPSGIPVVTFKLATTESWRDRGNVFREHTDWHTIVAWRGLAEVINKIVKKGSKVYIEGKLQTRNIVDKNGQRRFFVEVLADNMLLLDYRRSKDSYSADEPDSELTDPDYDSLEYTDDVEEPPRRDDDFPF